MQLTLEIPYTCERNTQPPLQSIRSFTTTPHVYMRTLKRCQYITAIVAVRQTVSMQVSILRGNIFVLDHNKEIYFGGRAIISLETEVHIIACHE